MWQAPVLYQRAVKFSVCKPKAFARVNLLPPHSFSGKPPAENKAGIFHHFCFSCMKQILLFGAGKSATVLIDYFLQGAQAEGWALTVVDASMPLVEEKIGGSPYGAAAAFDVTKQADRRTVIARADIVISLMPPALHSLIASDCLVLGKNLLTASYVDENMRQMQKEIEAAGLLFLCETGLDPGLDHMSAKRLIDSIKEEGGEILSFHSHCGGLVAPGSDDNPWRYKISWNPRNVVLAGKDGAVYLEDGEVKEMPYRELFAEKRYVSTGNGDALCWYPNRDSLRYIELYGLKGIPTFIRTTLRHPDFMYGWSNVVDLKLTNEEKRYQTDGKTLMAFFKEHTEVHGFGEWLQQKMMAQLDSTKTLLNELMHLAELETQASKEGLEPVEDFMMVDEGGDLKKIDIDYLKISAAATVADRMHDANLTLKQLFYLGMDDDQTLINKGLCSAADALQFALEKKLPLQATDKDMVVMVHEVVYAKGGKQFKATSRLRLEGENGIRTAMAKTVGLPLGVATKMILNGTLTAKGLRIPVDAEFYNLLFPALAEHGILFTEETVHCE